MLPIWCSGRAIARTSPSSAAVAEALVTDGDRVAHKADRCIGCGLCVTTCRAEALTLVRRPETEQKPVPDSSEDAWRAMIKA